VSEVEIAKLDGGYVAGRLYGLSDRTPVGQVLFLHGYLANSAFGEIPWAEDLTRLGFDVLFLDRTGHGASPGSLQVVPGGHGNLEVGDTLAALAFLKRRSTGQDRGRIAVIGHSAGATQALVAGTRDWSIEATAALAPSLGPAQYVNRWVPRNLLLVFGENDEFVLDESDRLLVYNSTRGVLDGPGDYGEPVFGTGRKLVRVPGSGHADLLFNREARRAVLAWLAASSGIDSSDVRLSSNRFGWLFVGMAASAVFVLFAGASSGPAHVAVTVSWKPALLPFAWIAGLTLASAFAPYGSYIPGQEAWVFVAISVAETVCLAMLALVLTGRGGLDRSVLAGATPDIVRGAIPAIVLCAGLELLLRHLFRVPLISGNRVLLAGLTSLAAFPMFCALEIAVRQMRATPLAAAASLAACVLVSMAIVPVVFIRISMFPAYVLAGAMLYCAIFRCRGASSQANVVFGTILVARVGAAVAALH
jgi:pimeloyl-ACP methyl ester carboxylesterase